MIIINSICSIALNILLLFSGVSNKTIKSERIVVSGKNDCGIDKVSLITKRNEKKRKFLFWKLRHKKVVIIDKVIDLNRNKILKRKSVFICSRDACDNRKVSRIKIVNNEIWVFKYGKKWQNDGIIKKYNFCGKYIGDKEWEKNDFYND